jgi:hypothetical protein
MSIKSNTNKKNLRMLGPENWESWVSHLAQRTAPIAPRKIIPARKVPPLLWGAPHGCAGSGEAPLTDRLCRLEGKKQRQKSLPGLIDELEPWLAAANGRPMNVEFALEALAWTHMLPELAGSLPAAPWWDVLDQLVALARETGDSLGTQDPLCHQLLAGELGLTLAYLFPEVKAARALRRKSARVVSVGAKELLDGNGMPHCRHLALLRPLLACWTRSAYLTRAEGKLCLKGDAWLQYEWLVRRALQLTRGDGSQVFGGGRQGRGDEELLDAALMLIDDADDNAIADLILPWRRAPRKARVADVLLPESAAHSEWASIAILRPSWRRNSEQLTVAFGERLIRTELNCGSQTVWFGPWNPSIVVDGTPLELQSNWEEICWHSDDDVDYVELEGRYQDNWVVQRQILLAREDHFLFVADAVLGQCEGDIDYRSTLPLCSDIHFDAADRTREGVLVGRKALGLVMPLSLPEWRASRADGELEAVAEGLQLRKKITGQRLYAPLFIDLKPKRSRLPLTWRSLTVAHQLEIQPSSDAVGYRVKAGGEQWLFYRSLAPSASRTVLGMNLLHEFYAARFDIDGEAEELLGIDSE